MTAFPITLDPYVDLDCAPLAGDLASSLVRLLDSARRNLDADRKAAEASIERASSLLQVEIDRQAAPSEGSTAGALAGWQVNRVKAYIDANLDAPILVSDLARVAQRSDAHFCRAFKRTFGESPHAFIIARRLDRAGELMLTSDASLSMIAIDCGFGDHAHFCKVFRARHGQSPSGWRRERRDLGRQTLAARLAPGRGEFGSEGRRMSA